jgi:hypothetical protein
MPFACHRAAADKTLKEKTILSDPDGLCGLWRASLAGFRQFLPGRFTAH